MANPTYTDDQVLKCAKTYEGYGEPVCPAMLRSLLADRKRLQAEVEVLRPDAERYKWLRDSHNGDLAAGREQDDGYVHILEGRHLDEAIDAARATPNETKEAKS